MHNNYRRGVCNFWDKLVVFTRGSSGNPVIKMYQRYLLGDSVGKIVTLLNDEGNFARNESKWTDSKVRAILEHERYCTPSGYKLRRDFAAYLCRRPH